MPSEVQPLVAIVRDAGIIGILLTILVGGQRGWWVFGWYHKAMIERLERDLNEWKTIALKGITTAEHATGLARKAKDRSVDSSGTGSGRVT